MSQEQSQEQSRKETPRLLFVHAHPDDETITNGGTIAHYTSRGAEVAVVTCTLGEEGEVIGEQYALLAVDHADQLGGYRIAELTQALNTLGVAGPLFLGGPGRWRDSGMAGSPARRWRRFIDAGDEAVSELVAIVDEMRPHVVVTYDKDGGYGHPDHINAHTVTVAAVAASRWSVPKLYWTVMATSAMTAGIEALGDVPAEWIKPDPTAIPFGYRDDEIDAVIDGRPYFDTKVDALRAHATQLTVGPDRRSFALSNGLALPILADEHYILAAGTAGDRDARGWETDLLAGVNLG
jgi:N-acetyl-1-D-myo-inositol-2-amino-2-deoxy-alpha-D-glucopyranoside deacetylase